MDTADWRQYHPFLRQTWHKQITAYVPNSVPDTIKVPVVVTQNNQMPTQHDQILIQHDQPIKPIATETFTNWKNPNKLKSWK